MVRNIENLRTLDIPRFTPGPHYLIDSQKESYTLPVARDQLT